MVLRIRGITLYTQHVMATVELNARTLLQDGGHQCQMPTLRFTRAGADPNCATCNSLVRDAQSVQTRAS